MPRFSFSNALLLVAALFIPTLGTSSVSLYLQMTTNAVNGCQTPTSVSTFNNTDAAVYVWFSIGADAGDQYTVNWYDPTGKLYRTVNSKVVNAGNYCLTDVIQIAGYPAASSLGKWFVAVVWLHPVGTNLPYTLFTDSFTIQSSTTTQPQLPLVVNNKLLTKTSPATSCAVPTPTTNFLTTDASAYVWFQISNGIVGDRPTFEWDYPNGSVYKTDAPWSPLTAGGSYCYWAKLDIAGQPPASSLGNWTAKVFWNGALLFSLSFAIQAPPPVTLNSRMMAKAVVSGACQTPTPATSFWPADASAYVWFSISGGLTGDQPTLEWDSPAGVVYKKDSWNSLTAPGSYCYSAVLDIAGQPPANLLGNWAVQVFWNAKLLFSLPFSIQAPMVSAASYSTLPPAPGSIVSVFGNFQFPFTFAQSLPLPTLIGNVEVLINGRAVPLFFVSPNQINFQIPWELQGVTEASLNILRGSIYNETRPIILAGFNPGIFATNQQGNGQGAILISNTPFFASPSGSFAGSRPVHAGEFISIFCSGLGAVFNQPASGAAASADVPSTTGANPSVTIGGIPATVSFSGLAPGSVGLYQVDAQIPDNAPSGSAVPVIITIGNVASNTVTIAVQ